MAVKTLNVKEFENVTGLSNFRMDMVALSFLLIQIFRSLKKSQVHKSVSGFTKKKKKTDRMELHTKVEVFI